MHQQQTHASLALALISALGMSANVNAASFYSISDAYTGSYLGTSYGWDISGDGSTVVGNAQIGQVVTYPEFPGYSVVEYSQSAFRWRIGSSLEVLPFGNATAASYDGSVVAGERYRWTQAGGAQDLGELGSGGATAAYGISADGSVVIGFSDGPNGREAYRWTETGGMQGLGFLPATNNLSRAEAVSADGSVVVGSGYGGAFIWTEATGMDNLATVGPLNQPFFGNPNGISADGSTVVGASPEAWFWTEGGGLQYLGFNQAVYDASGDGSVIVGGDMWSSSGGVAFIHDATHGTRVLKTLLQNDYGLDLTGWTLYAATGISDDGTKIAGVGVNPLGGIEAWYVDLAPAAVPVPPAVYLLGSGLLALVGLGKRKR